VMATKFGVSKCLIAVIDQGGSLNWTKRNPGCLLPSALVFLDFTSFNSAMHVVDSLRVLFVVRQKCHTTWESKCYSCEANENKTGELCGCIH